MAVCFVDLLGFGMVFPLMPRYARELGAPDAWIGLLFTSYSAMQFIFAPLWGRLSDRIGRRPVLLISIAMTALAFLGYGLAPNFAWLLTTRIFAGIATANLAVAQAYVADVTPPEQRARGMGLIGAAFGFGFVMGPALGGLLARHSLGAPAFAAAGLALANGVAAFFILPEPERHRTAAPSASRLAVFKEALGQPGVGRLLLCYFLAMAAFSAMESTFALLSADRYRLTDLELGYVFAFIGACMVLVQGALVGPLARRLGEQRLLTIGTVLMVGGLASLPYAPGVPGLLAGTALLAVGNGLVQPSVTSLLSRWTHAERQGGSLGLAQSAAAFGRIIGPQTGTFTFHLAPAYPYLGGASVMALASLLGLSLALKRSEE
jgi:MFS family permease